MGKNKKANYRPLSYSDDSVVSLKNRSGKGFSPSTESKSPPHLNPSSSLATTNLGIAASSGLNSNILSFNSRSTLLLGNKVVLSDPVHAVGFGLDSGYDNESVMVLDDSGNLVLHVLNSFNQRTPGACLNGNDAIPSMFPALGSSSLPSANSSSPSVASTFRPVACPKTWSSLFRSMPPNAGV